MKTFKLKLATVLFLFGLPFSSVMASQLPSYYPNNFSSVGTIQSLNISTDEISVRGKQLKLSASVKVSSPATRNATKSNLNQGMNIGFSLGEEGGRQTISEVWILPANYFDD